MCPLLAPGFQGFFLMWLLTVLLKQTRQAGRAIKQSIYLDVYNLMYLSGLVFIGQGTLTEREGSVQLTSLS